MKLKLYLLAMLLVTSSSLSWAADQNSVFKKIKQEGSLVYYAGSVTLEGEFWYPISMSEREVIGDQLCFNVADTNAKLIPREQDDTRSPWFCFKDTQPAAEQLGLTELAKLKVCELKGKVTVKVTNYVVDKAETDTNDTAVLVAVVKKPESVLVKLQNEDSSSCE